MSVIKRSIMCPKCHWASTRGLSDGSPDREGQRCWRCSGRYIEVVPKQQASGAVREALQRAAADLRSVAGRAEGPGGWYAAAHHIEKLAAGWGQ